MATSGTSPSFNCNQFTKDQAEHWTEKDRRSHLTLGYWLILAQLNLPLNTGQVPHPAPVPGGGLNNILRQITRIKLTAVKSISVASSMALVSSREMDCQSPLDCPGATETCISLTDLAANDQSQKQGIYWEVWTCATCTDEILCVAPLCGRTVQNTAEITGLSMAFSGRYSNPLSKTASFCCVNWSASMNKTTHLFPISLGEDECPLTYIK